MSENDECCICLCEMSNPITTTCKHEFHEECLLMWLIDNDTCPLCRAVLVDRHECEFSSDSSYIDEMFDYITSLLEEIGDSSRILNGFELSDDENCLNFLRGMEGIYLVEGDLQCEKCHQYVDNLSMRIIDKKDQERKRCCDFCKYVLTSEFYRRTLN